MRTLPVSPVATADLVALFTEHLRLCRVQEDEIVLITTHASFKPHYPAAFFAAARVLGATPYILTTTADMRFLKGPFLTDVWKNADMVIGCMSPMNFMYTEVHNEALKAGTRTLNVHEPEEVLRLMFPDEKVIARSKAGAAYLDHGRTIRVTSANGTDLVMDKTGRHGACEVGVSDTPGHFDHWPAGMVACTPVEGTCEGTLVLDEGDICWRFGVYFQHPVTITMEAGRIVDISGGADATLLRDYFAAANDDRSYLGPAHIGWGTDHRAKYHHLALFSREHGGSMTSASYYGNVLVAFGRDSFSGFGGTNDVAFHIDFPLKNHSLWVDDEQVIADGTIVHPQLQ